MSKKKEEKLFIEEAPHGNGIFTPCGRMEVHPNPSKCIPLGCQKPRTLAETVRRLMVNNNLTRDDDEPESWEEANDFAIDGEPDSFPYPEDEDIAYDPVTGEIYDDLPPAPADDAPTPEAEAGENEPEIVEEPEPVPPKKPAKKSVKK